MGSVGSPISSYPPNPNDIVNTYTNNCVQIICSSSCPQWCPFNTIHPDDDPNSGPNFSPLIIALITILGAGFILMIYYFIIRKYLQRRRNRSNSQNQILTDTHPDENLNRLIVNIDQLRSESRSGPGLDDGSIGLIAAFKYKNGDGLVEGTECAVCLNEFKEGESLRLLPNCSHAFHIPCIDAWLKSNAICPICRANGDPFLPPPGSRQVYAV